MTKINVVIDDDVVCSVKSNLLRSVDYLHDYGQVSHATSIDELLEAIGNSYTDMYEIYPNDDEEKLVESMSLDYCGKGPMEFPQIKATLLSYCVYNMGYHLGEGIEWGGSDTVYTEECFLTSSVARITCAYIKLVLKNWDLAYATDLFKEIAGMANVTDKIENPTSPMDFIMALSKRTAETVSFIRNELSSCSNITEHLKSVKRNFKSSDENIRNRMTKINEFRRRKA